MKKRIPFLLLSIFLILYYLPIKADAYSRHSGLFVASDYSDAYHVLFCRDASKIGNHRTYYNSTEDAEADGKRPCMHCGEYIRIIRGDYTGTASERDIVDAYLEGFYAGENYGNDEGFQDGTDYGYDKGYDDGRMSGKEDGYDDGYTVGYSDGAESVEPDLTIPLIIAAVCAFAAYNYGKRKSEDFQTASESELSKLRVENSNLKSALAKRSAAIDTLDIIAKEVNCSSDALMDNIYINFMMKKGHTEADAHALLRQRKQERTY